MLGEIRSDWTYAVTHIAAFADGHDEPLGNASGFFWKAGERTFLVTNWHVLSGRRSDDRQPCDPRMRLPDWIQLMVYSRTKTHEGGYFSFEMLGARVPLHTGDTPHWMEHPAHHNAADVAVMDVTPALKRDGIHFKTANELEHDALVEPRVGDDAFVLGYPLGILGKSPLPLWKGATVATEPAVDHGDLPRVLVDSATRQGMSGSVAIARRLVLGPYQTSKGPKSDNLIGVVDRVLGVYSGRLGDDEVRAQIGIVWKRRLIDEIIATGVPGNNEFCAPSDGP